MLDKNYEPVMQIGSRNTLSEAQLQTFIETGKKTKANPCKKRKKLKDSPPTNKKPGRLKCRKKAVDNALRNVHNKKKNVIHLS